MSASYAAQPCRATDPQTASSSREQVQPARPLKICLLGYRSAPFSGGQGIYLRYLSKALLEAGHQVDVISGQPYPDLVDGVRLIKLPGMNLYETGLGSLRLHHLRSWTNIVEWTGKLSGGFSEPYCFGRRVYKYLRRHGRHYDVIHDNQCLSYGTLALQKKGFPLLTTIHHPITHDRDIALAAAKTEGERKLIARWHSFLDMQRKVARQLHHIVTVSERSRQDIAGAFAIQPAAIHLVHCGVDTEVFRPIPEIAKIPRRIMATVSADQPLKGVTFLLRALAEVVRHYPDVELLMVGKPKADGEAERLIEQLGLSPNIRCVRGIDTDTLVTHYNEAEIVVVPSLYEGFGLPAAEAMACGTAVISSDGGALPEVVGDAAEMVPAGHSDALARALIDLLADDGRRHALAAAGRRRIEGMFSWRRAAEEMVTLYRTTLMGQSTRTGN